MRYKFALQTTSIYGIYLLLRCLPIFYYTLFLFTGTITFGNTPYIQVALAELERIEVLEGGRGRLMPADGCGIWMCKVALDCMHPEFKDKSTLAKGCSSNQTYAHVQDSSNDKPAYE